MGDLKIKGILLVVEQINQIDMVTAGELLVRIDFWPDAEFGADTRCPQYLFVQD